ncbi:MAG: hypothetical protein ACQEP6_02255 [Patescibacteria group bacterium]
MELKNSTYLNKVKKIPLLLLCSVLIFNFIVFLFPTPQEVKASQYVPVRETGRNLSANEATEDLTRSFRDYYYEKEYNRDGIAWLFVKEIINSTIVDEILSWANSGFEGEPAFIENPGNFFSSMGGEVLDQIISENFEYLCSDFRPHIEAAITYKYKEARDREAEYSCTLDDAVANLQTHYDDFVSGNFYRGGWEGLFALSQNSQNNPYGAYLKADMDMEEEVIRNAELARQELEWGSGLFSIRDGGVISMPGDILKDQINETLSSDIRQLEHADELTEMIAMLIGQLVSNVVTSDSGLGGGSGYSDPGEFAPDDQQEGENKELTQTFAGQSFKADVEGAMLTVGTTGGGSFVSDNTKTIDNLTIQAQEMAFMGSTGTGGSTMEVKDGDVVEVDNITFLYDAGDVYNVPEGGSYKQGTSITLDNVKIKNPEFMGVENSTTATVNGSGSQEINDVHYLGPIELTDADLEGAYLEDVTLKAPEDADPSNLEGGEIQDGTGTGVDKLLTVDSYEYNDGSFRGSVADENVTLNNVMIVGGEVVDDEGEVVTDGSGHELKIDTNLYCGGDNPCTVGPGNFSASGVNNIRIDDTSGIGTWSYSTFSWSEQSGSIIEDFTISHGEITKHY